MASLTWLHLSDLHACKARSGWDAGRVRKTLVADLVRLQEDHDLRPDLVFFTGDAAFGHLGAEPGKRIDEQFQEAAGFFDAVRQAFSPEVPKSELFLVPGNHDVDRRHVSTALTYWLSHQQELSPVIQLIQDAASVDWQLAMRRLAPYLEFLRTSELGHLLGDAERAIWSAIREVQGVRVGIAGFNSAWSCGGKRERGHLWAAGRWQQGTLREGLRETDISIALMHHPPDWLVEQETPQFGRDLRQDFRFLLHGHEHKDWVEATDDGFTTISAGACYDRSDKENGYNLVRLDFKNGLGKAWLRRYDASGGGWEARKISGQTDDLGAREFRFARPHVETAPRDRTQGLMPELTTRLPLSSTKPSPELTRYIERLRFAHSYLPFFGFMARLRPIRLESVYVRLVVHHAMESEQKKPESNRKLAIEAEEESEIAFDQALSLALEYGFQGVIVLGDPGTGKTTLLKHFLLAVTGSATVPDRLGFSEEIVPVFIELRHLGEPAAGLFNALTEAVERADPGLSGADFARSLLQRDYLLVLADGLDEIADTNERAKVSRWLEEAAGTLPHSTFVVTSRYAGYQGDARLSGRFLELHVRGLEEREARCFLRDWYTAVETQAKLGRSPEVAQRLAKKAAEQLAEEIFDLKDPRTASLRELATNPLMLQILCLVHRDRKHLPERRVELYGECCQVLLELGRDKGMSVTLTTTQAFKLLQPLAYWLHTHERKEMTAEEIEPLLAAPLRELGRSPSDASTLLAVICGQSGILVNVGGVFTFLHLSFQSYLCARHLQDQVIRSPRLLSELACHFGETWWREVILLTVGLDNPGLFESLMQEILRWEVLQRDVRLADDCLRDASAPTPRPLLEALAQGLTSVEERYHALRLLRSLPGWESESLPSGKNGREVVESLARDHDLQVQGMVAELLGSEKAVVHILHDSAATARSVRRGEPSSGEEWLNQVDGTVLLYVPGGEYVLGADDLTGEEKPVFRSILSPFWIGKYLVTNEQYGKFLRSQPKIPRPKYWDERQFNHPHQPVVGVSWEDAQAYCRWAHLRLPSEAQWEAAARGTDGRRYPWGNEEPTAEHANFGDREARTTPVGAFPRGAGPFGTLDQAGNVWEWCEDVWDAEAYRSREGAEDPVGTDGDPAFRCLRGGAWDYEVWNLAAAGRGGRVASSRGWNVGFRCSLPGRVEG